MRMARIAGIGAWLALLAQPPAQAQAPATTQTLAEAGPWRAYRTTTTRGQPLCGLSHMQGTRAFLVKHGEGDPGLWVQLASRSWRIPARARAEVALEVDGQPALAGPMTKQTGRTDMLVRPLPEMEAGLRFVRRLGEGQRLRIAFADGDEGEWLLPLAGTRPVAAAFARCVAEVTPPGTARATPRETPATQPFGAAPSRPAGPTGSPKAPAPPS